jgi:hypothetical protein
LFSSTNANSDIAHSGRSSVLNEGESGVMVDSQIIEASHPEGVLASQVSVLHTLGTLGADNTKKQIDVK